MKIKRIEPIAVRLPLKKPIKRSQGELRTSDNLIVRIESDGAVGWGEAGSAPNVTGELPEGMVAAVRYVAPYLEGLPLEDVDRAAAVMNHALSGNHGAKAAVEMALHDALGKALGKPACELLGGKRRGRVPALRYIASGDTAKDAAEAARLKSEGYVAYKIKLSGKWEQEVERTRRVCEALGKGVLVSADVNQGWTVEQAVNYVRAVADTTLEFLEQPVAAEDLAGMASVVAASRVKIACDEGMQSVADLERHHEMRAAHGTSLKLIKLGGMRPLYQTALLCEKLGMKVNLSCKIAESGIASAAVLQLAAALPSLDWGVSLTSQYLAEDVLVQPLRFENGEALIPSGPGLGIDVDEARVRRFSANQ